MVTEKTSNASGFSRSRDLNVPCIRIVFFDENVKSHRRDGKVKSSKFKACKS